MSRLILFSGGVESTALLSIAGNADYLLTVVMESEWYAPSIDLDKNKKLAGMSGLNSIRVKMNYPVLEGLRFVHQVQHFLGVCNVLVQAYGFTEVWMGLNSTEPPAHSKASYDRAFAAWEKLCPDVPFIVPFGHMTKAEQWRLIPKEMREFVVSCAVHQTLENGCKKCMERKEAEDESNRKLSSES